MDRSIASRLAAHAAVVLLLGMLAGFPFGLAVTGGDTEGIRAWRMAHLEGVTNGLLMLAVAAASPLLRLSPRAGRWLYRLLLATGYANVLASALAATARVRGLEPGGPLANWAVFLGFTSVVVAVLVALVMIAIGGFRPGGRDQQP